MHQNFPNEAEFRRAEAATWGARPAPAIEIAARRGVAP